MGFRIPLIVMSPILKAILELFTNGFQKPAPTSAMTSRKNPFVHSFLTDFNIWGQSGYPISVLSGNVETSYFYSFEVNFNRFLMQFGAL